MTASTLADELRSVTRERILHGARSALATIGFDATVDDVAVAGGVSRRTVFRHFSTQEALLAAAVDSVYREYDAQLPRDAPSGPADLERWLTDTLTIVYRLNRDVLGAGFWQIHTIGARTRSDELRRSVVEAGARRRGWAHQLVDLAWEATESSGPPPPWLLDAFSLLGSAFAMNGLAVGGLSLDESVEVAVRTFVAALDAALVS